VGVWGLSILGFGLVTSFAAGLALLAAAGAADSVSAVCRSTMMQTLTPDHLRGRTAATFSMVVVGGTYLGDVEAGAVAAATTPRFSVISGGGLCLIGAALVAALIPALRRYRARPAIPGVPPQVEADHLGAPRPIGGAPPTP
jgi:sugar phosphate permease